MEEKSQKVVGIHPVMEAVLAGRSIDKLFIQDGLKGENVEELKRLASQMGVYKHFVPKEKLDRLHKGNHQGVIAFIAPVEFAPLEETVQGIFERGEEPFLLILDRVSDVRNFGSLARSAECAGVNAIVVPQKGAAAINEEAMKASAGALFNIPVCKVNSLPSAIRFLRISGIKVVACSEKAQVPYYGEDLSGPVGILLGSEGEGIGEKSAGQTDFAVSIPMAGTTGSLNVAVAGGIILFEVLRQRQGR